MLKWFFFVVVNASSFHWAEAKTFAWPLVSSMIRFRVWWIRFRLWWICNRLIKRKHCVQCIFFAFAFSLYDREAMDQCWNLEIAKKRRKFNATDQKVGLHNTLMRAALTGMKLSEKMEIWVNNMQNRPVYLYSNPIWKVNVNRMLLPRLFVHLL